MLVVCATVLRYRRYRLSVDDDTPLKRPDVLPCRWREPARWYEEMEAGRFRVLGRRFPRTAGPAMCMAARRAAAARGARGGGCGEEG